MSLYILATTWNLDSTCVVFGIAHVLLSTLTAKCAIHDKIPTCIMHSLSLFEFKYYNAEVLL